MDHLKAREEHLVKAQARRLRGESFFLQKPVVEARELAEKLGVLEEALEEVLKEKELPGYIRLGDMLIRETKLEEIRKKLEDRLNQGALTLIEASRIVEGAGGRRTVNVLDVLGYNLEWHGIDPHLTRVRRKTET